MSFDELIFLINKSSVADLKNEKINPQSQKKKKPKNKRSKTGKKIPTEQ